MLSLARPWGNLYHQWDAVRKRAGLDGVRMHDLRHSFASNLVNSGRSIYEVGRLLGHSQVKTTQRYAHHGGAPVVFEPPRSGGRAPTIAPAALSRP